MVGLRAAKAAGMKCVITYTQETADQDFYAGGAECSGKPLLRGRIGGGGHSLSDSFGTGTMIKWQDFTVAQSLCHTRLCAPTLSYLCSLAFNADRVCGRQVRRADAGAHGGAD